MKFELTEVQKLLEDVTAGDLALDPPSYAYPRRMLIIRAQSAESFLLVWRGGCDSPIELGQASCGFSQIHAMV